MIDLELARRRWLDERATYEAFGRLIAVRMGDAAKERGIWCDSTSRAKEPHSLIKKLLKGKYTYETLPDKVGARCVVRYLTELDRLVELALSLFKCHDIDKKIERLGAEQLGYASTHIEVRLKDDDPEVVHYGSYCAELQIKTLGQHLWSEMSHDSVYKNDDMLSVLPVAFRRRVNLMAGLIEVADQEFDRLNDALPSSPSNHIYKAIERHYFKLTTKRPDIELSLEIIDLLLPLYGEEPPKIAQTLDSFFQTHEETLQLVYSESESVRSSALLYQPEVLMILERLEADQLSTRKAWSSRFPEEELERVANLLGISFD